MDSNSHTYQVVFSGKLQNGKRLDEVKQAVASTLRLSAQKCEALFSGRKVLLMRSDTLAKAEAFLRLFNQTGAMATLESVAGEAVQNHGAEKALPVTTKRHTLPPYRPFPANWLFKPALLIVTAIESFLTLLYVLLLGGGILLLIYHTLVSGWLFDSLPMIAATLLSILLLVAGTLALILLAKPLLGFIHRREPLFDLLEENEPEFFNFVAEISLLAGVVPPAKIKINNGAALSVRQIWQPRALLRREKQLTIGLSLLAGLDSRQLAALLAQALHPWRPGFFARLEQLLDGNLRWLHRAAYSSDPLDRTLRGWQVRLPKLAPFLKKLAHVASWSTKPALWRLKVSRVLSRRLAQRLVADADQLGGKVAGSDTLATALERSRLVAFAAQNTMPTLKKMWESKGELPDNIATAIVARAAQYPTQIQQQLNAMQARHIIENGAFWPSVEQRLQHIRQQQQAGEYDIAAPCSVFFLRLDKLMRIMSVRYYHAHLHLPVTTNKLVHVTVKGSQEYEADQRIARFFGHTYVDFAQLHLLSQRKSLSSDPRRLVQQWRLAVTRLQAEQAKAETLSTALHTADNELIEVSNREVLQRAGVGSALTGLARFKGGDSEALQQQCRDAEAAWESATAALEKLLEPYALRLSGALALLDTTEVQRKLPNAGMLSLEIQQLLSVHDKIEHNAAKLRELRQQVILLESLLSYDNVRSTAKLRDRINELADDIRRVLTAFGVFYKSVPYPLSAEEHYRNLLDWVQAQSSTAEGAVADFDRGNDMVRRMAMLQRLIVGRLVSIALSIESSIGLTGVKKPA